jgi:hypothetical protein
MPLFAVIRSRGPAWEESRPLDQQANWGLAENPWSTQDLLRVSRIAPWTLRLGSLH